MKHSAPARVLRSLGLALLAAPPLAALAPAQTGPAVPTPSAAGAGAGDPTMLRLANGRVLWGSIVGHDPETLDFHRVDNGGTVHLSWSYLDPSEEEALRLRFGYVDASAEELMVKADRLVLDDGTEVVGMILGRTDDYLNLKRASGTQPVPKRRIVGAPTMVQVPALDVYTKEELYQNKAFELQAGLIQEGRPGAEAHYELARFAERLFDYPHAAEHFRLVQKLDPAFMTEAVDASVARTEAKAALQEQVDFLAEIDLWRARKRFDRSLELLAQFPERYPKSPLMDDWNTLRDRVAKYQERELREQVVTRWHYWASAIARRAAREAEGYEAALAFAEESLGEQVLAKVTADLDKLAPGIQPDQVRRLWEAREGGRFRQASYGNGTWLLGKERAAAELKKDEEAEQVEAGSAAEQRKRLQERLDRYFENQVLSRKAKGGGQDESEDPEAFWKDYTTDSKAQWLLAYYAENSGDMRVEKIRFAPCRECGGTGTRNVIFLGGTGPDSSISEAAVIPCPTCHTVQVVRRVRYR